MSVLNRLTLLEHMVDNLNTRLQAIEDSARYHIPYRPPESDTDHLYPRLSAVSTDAELTVSTAAELTCPPATSP